MMQMKEFRENQPIATEKLNITEEWQPFVFPIGAWKMLTDNPRSIAITEEDTYQVQYMITEDFVILCETEKTLYIKSLVPGIELYRYDLNEVANFITQVEEYKQAFEEYKIATDARLEALEAYKQTNDQRITALEERVSRLEQAR